MSIGHTQMSIRPLDEQKCPLDIHMSICPMDEQKCPVDIQMSIGHLAEVLDMYAESLLHVVAGCQSYLDRFTWRHNSILNFIANALESVDETTLFADLRGFRSPSILTGETYRPDLLFSCPIVTLYVVELTVGYESNLHNNAKRKEAKYRELVSQLHETYNQVKFVNLSMSSPGIFAQECSAFLDTPKNVGFDDNQRLYCVRKMITIAIRTTYYIFCCRNKEWDNPELLAF